MVGRETLYTACHFWGVLWPTVNERRRLDVARRRGKMGNPAKPMPYGVGIPALGIPISNGARRQGTSAIRVCGQRQ